MANFYLAEALLYADNINESIESLNLNTKIETDDDISFLITNANEKSNGSNNQNEPLNIQEMMTSTNKSKYYHFSQLNFSNIESYIKYLLIFVEVNENRKNNQLKWYPKDVNTAKAIAYFNLSVAHAVRSEIDIAFKNFNMVMFLFLKNIHLNN